MAKSSGAVKSLSAAAGDIFGGITSQGNGVNYWLDTGFLPLNKAISGSYDNGIPSQRMIEIFGGESCGKCLTADTYLLTEHGMLTIAELFEREGFKATCVQKNVEHAVKLVNENYDLEPTSHLVWNGRRKTKEITLKTGQTIKATHKHPIRVMSEQGFIVWKKAADIEVGDKLPIMVNTAVFGSGTLAKEEAELIGYLVADGALSNKNSVRFSNSDPEVAARFSSIMHSLYGVEVVSHKARKSNTVDHYVNNTVVRKSIADKYDLDYVVAKDKKVPLCVRTANMAAQVEFLRAYFELECYIAQNRKIEVSSASNQLILEVQLMLLNIGVASTITSKFVDEVEYWRLTITGDNFDSFLVCVGFDTAARKDQLSSVSSRSGNVCRSTLNSVPNINDLLTQLVQSSSKADREGAKLVADYINGSKLSVSYNRLSRILDHFELKRNALNAGILYQLNEYLVRAYAYSEVTSIADGEEPTFDVSLPETHSFWSNGVISHNTAIATNAMISAQKASGVALFMDHERSFMPHLAEQAGLCIDPAVGNFIHAVPDTFEQSLDTVTEYAETIRDNELIPKEAPILVVFDSLAAMVPKSKMVKKNEEQGMHDNTALARACSAAFPALQIFAEKYNMCILILNQTRENIGVMFGDNTTTPGGNAKNFYYSVRIGLHRKMIKDKDKNVIGQEIKAKVIKNKVSAPYKECVWQFSFREDGTGFLDSLHSSIDYLIEKGVMKQTGAYVEFNGKKTFRSQLTDKIRDAGQEEKIYNMIRALDSEEKEESSES